QRQHGRQGRSAGQGRAGQRLVDRQVDDRPDIRRLLAAHQFPDPVEDDHRVVDRVTGQRQQRRHRRQVEIELQQGEQPHRHQHVVPGRDQRRDRELPLEAEIDVDADRQDREDGRHDAIAKQLAAYLRADLFDPPIIPLGPEDLADLIDGGLGCLVRVLRLDADQHLVLAPEVLEVDLAELEATELRPQGRDVDGLLRRDFHQDAAAEIDPEIEALHAQRDDRRQGHQPRQDEGEEALPDEVDLRVVRYELYAVKRHGFTPTARQPADTPSGMPAQALETVMSEGASGGNADVPGTAEAVRPWRWAGR